MYSSTGLGKTHLLRAIEDACLASGTPSLYVTAEVFASEFLCAIGHQKTEEFRNRYLGVEVLLIDDVQLISSRERTQDELFHIFNHLHQAGRQLVIASDRPPQALRLLEDRLRSRFEWGLIVDIRPPDLETRTEILRAKANELRAHVDEKRLETIAEAAPSNILEMEQYLRQCQDHEIPVCLDSAVVRLP